MPSTLEELVKCAKRELAYRRYVYPNRVSAGKMKPEQMKHETACMERIVQILEELAQTERLL